jgi:hypothetical protein
MELRVEVLHAQIVRGLAAIARQKALAEAERAGWPLPRQLAVHLYLLDLGLSRPD